VPLLVKIKIQKQKVVPAIINII